MNKYVVEAIGTFFFVLTIVGAVASGLQIAPIAIGASLMVMIYAGGHISGGHFNPAVSLAAFIRGRLATADLLPTGAPSSPVARWPRSSAPGSGSSRT